MAYIGIDPNVGDISFQTFTGDGSATTFTLAQSVASGEAIIVTIGNVVQEPGASAAYVAYANTLTFSAAPANGDVITVRYFGRAVDQPLSYGMQLFKYVATASQTVFTGADSSGTVLAFSGTDVDVYLNGVHLDADDFTASSGDTITLATGATLNDELVIRAFRAFTITDTVSASSGGTFNGAVNVNGTVTADGLTVDGDVNVTSALPKIQFTDTTGSYQSRLILNDTEIQLDNQSTGGIRLRTDNFKSRFLLDANGDISFYEDTGTSAKFFWDASAEALGIGITSPTALLDAYKASQGGSSTFRAYGPAGQILWANGGASTSYLDSDTIVFRKSADGGNTERMRITSAGNVGIGTSSPQGIFEASGGVSYFTRSGKTVIINPNYSNLNTNTRIQADTGMALAFATNGDNERMRIDSSGRVKVGTTSTVSTATNELFAVDAGTSGGHGGVFSSNTSGGYACVYLKAGTNVSNLALFYKNTSIVGSITTNGSSTSYNTSSDYRLKTAVTYDWDATTRLKQLRPARFEWIADGDDAVPVDGFLAHEVQDIVPEAITGTHNEVDDEGNPVYQGIDQSKLTPLLTKALIEAVEKIEQLEARIAALEAN